MLKLVKYLKTSILPILLIVLLLVVQAMCDLSLPDYTAKIVDIGIQKGGIEDAVPTLSLIHIFTMRGVTSLCRSSPLCSPAWSIFWAASIWWRKGVSVPC